MPTVPTVTSLAAADNSTSRRRPSTWEPPPESYRKGVGLYTIRGSYPLAGLFGTTGVFNRGADITVITTGGHSDGVTAGDLIGDLDMYSSSIASLNGGNIYINANGDINAGSADFSVNTLGARGIYTTGQGNVDVYAEGNINVNGSRIANYDLPRADGSTTPGGSVTVVSLNGDINAGNGSSGFVVVSSYQGAPMAPLLPKRRPFRAAAFWESRMS